jgi:hypothetical protein
MAQYPPPPYVAPAPTVAIVPVKSDWYSKIIWTNLAAPAATALAFFGMKDVSVDQLTAIFGGIQAVQSVATIFFRKYYNGSVSASSLPPGSVS